MTTTATSEGTASCAFCQSNRVPSNSGVDSVCETCTVAELANTARNSRSDAMREMAASALAERGIYVFDVYLSIDESTVTGIPNYQGGWEWFTGTSAEFMAEYGLIVSDGPHRSSGRVERDGRILEWERVR